MRSKNWWKTAFIYNFTVVVAVVPKHLFSQCTTFPAQTVWDDMLWKVFSLMFLKLLVVVEQTMKVAVYLNITGELVAVLYIKSSLLEMQPSNGTVLHITRFELCRGYWAKLGIFVSGQW